MADSRINVVYDEDIKKFFAIPSWPDKFSRFGNFLKPKFEAVQIIGQIEPERNPETYHLLRDYLGEYVSSRINDGFQLINEAKSLPPLRNVLALYAVWTSIYHPENNETDSYWDKFYKGLPNVNRNQILDNHVGDAVKRVLAESPNLESFPRQPGEPDTWVHVSQILLHGLPQKHVERFIEECVLSESAFNLSEESQRQAWLRQLEQANLYKSTLQRFFRRGGDVVLAYTQAFQALRDAWNEDHYILTQTGLPAYMQTIFKQVAQRRPTQKKTLRPSIPQEKPPFLCMVLERYMQPFLVIPPRRVLTQPFKTTISSPQNTFQRTIDLLIPKDGPQYSREALPETEEKLLIPPAQAYQVSFSGETEPFLIAFPYPGCLIFDARTGKFCNLKQDIRWPEQLLVVLNHSCRLETDGAISEAISLQEPWQDWRYHLISEPKWITLQASGHPPLKLKANVFRQNLRLRLDYHTPPPYWVHPPESIQLVTDFSQLEISCEGLKSFNSRLEILAHHKSYPIQILNVSKSNSKIKIKNFQELEPGLYTILLWDGVNKIGQEILYLPEAKFLREPVDCNTHLAEELKFRLPQIKWRLIEKLEYAQSDEWDCRIRSPRQAAIGLELFPYSIQATTLYLILQDVRWRRYGQARIPHVREMLTKKESIPLRELEKLTDSRLRVEVEYPVFEMIKQRNNQVFIELRDAQDNIIVPDKAPVKYHRNAYWDLDMLDLVKEVLSGSQDKYVSIGMQLDGTYLPLVEIGLILDLQDLKVEPLGFDDSGNQQKFCLTWTPRPQDPPIADILFRIGTIQELNKEIQLKAYQLGKLEFDLPVTDNFINWGLYAERINPQNPFANAGPFEPSKITQWFIQKPKDFQFEILSCKYLTLEYKYKYWYQIFELLVQFDSRIHNSNLEFLFFPYNLQIPEKEIRKPITLEESGIPNDFKRFIFSLRLLPESESETWTIEVNLNYSNQRICLGKQDVYRFGTPTNLNSLNDICEKIDFSNFYPNENSIYALINNINDIYHLLYSSDAHQILNGIDQLQYYNVFPIKLLVNQLKKNDLNQSHKLAIIKALGMIRNHKCIPGLISLLQDDQTDVSLAALKSLIQINTSNLTELLFNEINKVKINNYNFNFFDNTLILMRKIYLYSDESDELINQLKNILLENTNLDLMEFAIRALGELQVKSANEFILKAFEIDELKLSAASALIKIGDRRKPILEFLNKKIQFYIQRMEDHFKLNREKARLELIKIGGYVVNQRLISAIENNSTPWTVREGAAIVLGKLKCSEAKNVLLTLVKSNQLNEKIAAIEALGSFPSPEIVDCLEQLKPFNDPYIKSAVNNALKELEKSKLLQEIEEFIKYQNEKQNQLEPKVTKEYNLSKDEMNATPAIHLLIETLQNSNDVLVKIDCINALAKQKSTEAIPILIKTIQESNYSPLIIACIQALQELKANDAIPYFKKALQHDITGVRVVAISALGELKVTEAKNDLVTVFNTNFSKKTWSPQIYLALLKAFKDLHATDVLPQLEQARNRVSKHLRAQLEQTIQTLSFSQEQSIE